jgi:hypothetical protein
MPRMKLWLSTGAIAGLTVAAACGRDDGAADRSRTHALTADGGQYCTADLIDQSGKPIDDVTCAGPWEYKRYQPCYKLGEETTDPAAAECGETGSFPMITCFGPPCSHPSFGVQSRTTLNLNGSRHRTCRTVKVCERMCGDYVCKTTPSPQQASPPPSTAANQLCWYEQCDLGPCDLSIVDRTLANYNYGTYGDYSSQIVVNQDTAACTATLSNVPVFATGTSAVCPGSHECADESRPIYASCRRQSAGLEPDQSVCGPNLESDLLYSRPGQTYAQVRATTDATLTDVALGGPVSLARAAKSTDALPKCTTADEMPMSTPDQARAKFDRLESYRGNAAAIAANEVTIVADGFEGWFWTTEALAGSAALWEFLPSGTYPFTSPHGESRLARFNSYFASRGSQARLYFFFPIVNLSSEYSGILLRYWMYTDPGWVASNDRVQVQISIDGGPWTDVGSPASRYSSTASWIQNTLDLSAYSGQPNVRLAFLGTSEYGNDIYIDDVSVNGELINLDSEITKHERLLFDLRADLLNEVRTANPSQTYVERILELARAKPRDHFEQCTSLLPNLPAPSTLAEEAVDVGLQMCERLSRVPAVGEDEYPTTAESNINWCLDRAADIKALPDTSSIKPQYRAEYAALQERLFQRILVTAPADSEGDFAPMSQRVPILRNRLASIQRWHDTVTGWLYSHEDVLARYTETSKLLKLLWKGNMKPADDKLVQTLDPELYQNQAFSAQRSMLLAAFPEAGQPAPMSGELLLPVVADALKPLTIRLAEVDRYRDLVCLFRGNCATYDPATHKSTGVFRDELSQLHRLLGTLHDPDLFSAANDGATSVTDSDDNGWRTVFKRIQQNHSLFEKAVRSAFVPAKSAYDKSYLEKGSVWTESGTFLTDLAALVQDSKRKLDNYNQTGLFLTSSNVKLAVGLSKQKQVEIQDAVSGYRESLDKQVTDYETTRNILVNNLLGQLSNSQIEAATLNRINIQAAAIDNQSKDLAGLRLNAEAEAAQLADFGTAFQSAVDKWNTDPAFAAYKIDIGAPVKTLSVTGASAVFSGARSGSIADYRIPNWKVQAAAGDILNIEVTGQWSPTCALSRTTKFNGKNRVIGTNSDKTSGAITGPQGFQMSFVEDHYETTSHTVSSDYGHYSNYTELGRACAGISVKYDGGLLGDLAEAISGLSAEVHASADACVESEWGRRTSTTTSDGTNEGSDTRNSAAFSYGLRLNNTPFPEYPVGSLLLVKMAPGKTSFAKGDLLDVRVLQSMNSIPVDLPSNLEAGALADFYLVANELNSKDCVADTSNALAVTVSKLVSSGEAALKFGAAMNQVTTTLRAEAKKRLSQGRVLPQDMQSLRDAAVNQLGDSCGKVCSPSTMPTAMTGFFNAWVSSELARLERELEIRQAERQMETAMLELKGMNTELQSLRQEARLLAIQPGWTLQTLDADHLRSATNDLMGGLVDWVYPMVRLRYPETITLLENDDYTRGLMDKMQAVSWNSTVLEMARTANDFAERVLTKLDSASIKSPSTGVTYPVVVAFPNPYFKAPLGTKPTTYPYSIADETRSREVWDRLEKRTDKNAIVSIKLLPEDIYNALGGASNLICTQASPIISSMAIHVYRGAGTATVPDTNNIVLNNYAFSVPVSASPKMSFPLPEGPLGVEATEASFLSDKIRVTFGTPDQALNYFHAASGPSSTPVLSGLSLVNSFEVNFAMLVGHGVPVDPFAKSSAQALFVVADVDPRKVGSPGVTGVQTCN